MSAARRATIAQASTSSVSTPSPAERRNQSPTPALLTADEAAQRLSISTRMLGKLVKAGDIPRVRLGRLVRFEESDISNCIAQLKEERPLESLPPAPLVKKNDEPNKGKALSAVAQATSLEARSQEGGKAQ